MKLDEYRKCFALSYDEFVAAYSIHPRQIHEHLRYEKVMDVTRIDLAKGQFFFFKDGQLRVIYLSDDVLTKAIWSEFKSVTKTSAPDDTVRSRAGKTSNQFVFCGQGITASLTKAEVDFIELYPPCSLEEYVDQIYDEPGPFIR